MNVFGKKRERSWRKARKRGVSPIIATILLVAITVVLAAVLYVLISGLTTGGANTVPIGTSFTLGMPTQSTTCGTSAPGSCYTASVQSAGSSATTANIHFSVQKSGAGQTFGSVIVLDISGSPLATYTAAGGWVTGGTAGSATLPLAFNSTQSLVISWGGTTSLSGDNLIVSGVGGLQGTESYALP